jgi:hypothetical protein
MGYNQSIPEVGLLSHLLKKLGVLGLPCWTSNPKNLQASAFKPGLNINWTIAIVGLSMALLTLPFSKI